MASVVFNSFVLDLLAGNIDVSNDALKFILTNGYTPNKDTHARRSDVTGEVVAPGYTAGGSLASASVVLNPATDSTSVMIAEVTWPESSIVANGGVLYKSRGGPSGKDELIAFVDFGAQYASNNGTFRVSFDTPLTIQN
jgi:hypothetical protein